MWQMAKNVYMLIIQLKHVHIYSSTHLHIKEISPAIKQLQGLFLFININQNNTVMNADQYKYASVTYALDDLRARGYVDEFDFKDKYLFCNSKGVQFNPQELKITEVYRFEGASDPEDSSVVYAIESAAGLKGVMIDAYGAYADEQKTAFINSLTISN
jgi:hypothetical protein